MACGTPVLGTPVGGTEEILSHFNPQFLFKGTSPEDIADGIQSATREHYSDKKKYNELRIRCREHTEERYSWQRHTDQLKEVLYEAIEVKKVMNQS